MGRRLARWALGATIVAMVGLPEGAAGQELTELSAGDAAARIRARTLQSEDLVRALVEVIERRRDRARQDQSARARFRDHRQQRRVRTGA
jgi:hypothetical protein